MFGSKVTGENYTNRAFGGTLQGQGASQWLFLLLLRLILLRR